MLIIGLLQTAEYKHHRAIFDAKARESTKRFAMQTTTQRGAGSSRDDRPQIIAPQMISPKDEVRKALQTYTFYRSLLSLAVLSSSRTDQNVLDDCRLFVVNLRACGPGSPGVAHCSESLCTQ